MPERRSTIIRLLSVTLTREKQTALQEEFRRYAAASNWVIKSILKSHLRGHARIKTAIEEKFMEEYDKRPVYLDNVITTAVAEIGKHDRLATTIRSMRDKAPHFKLGRMILSQPIVQVGDRAATLTLPDRTKIPIPYDKRSRNKSGSELAAILHGESNASVGSGGTPINKRYERVRFTWNTEGFLDIDVRAFIPKKPDSFEED